MFLLATCVALVHHIYLSDGDYPHPRRDTILLLNIADITGERGEALVVDAITIQSHRLVMPVRRAGVGSGTRPEAHVLLLACQIDAAPRYRFFSASLDACCLPRYVETHDHAASFGRGS